MKLRILGNSLRLRLSQKEVRALEEKGFVKQKAEFGFDSKDLKYTLKATLGSHDLQATFMDHEILIEIPEAWVRGWEVDDRVGFNTELTLGNGRNLKIVVEKDFKCLTVRPGEDESDNFPNPLEGKGHPHQ